MVNYHIHFGTQHLVADVVVIVRMDMAVITEIVDATSAVTQVSEEM